MANGFDEIKEALSNIKTEDFKWKDESDEPGFMAQETDEIEPDTITLNSSLWSSSSFTISTAGAIGSAGSYLYNGMNGTTWSTAPSITSSSTPPSLSVTGEANFEGDVKIKGVSIAKVLDDIQSRLAILVPDPAKLEHFEALKKAYNNYKTLEALCDLPKETKE
jgi:hypothetical protein